ncbi:MAG: HRDC domain-containing protein [Anaerolineales bacterium]|nr:HRDC domain-containing protein [Anaerolineales bacterium]MDP7544498.1 HRDC domain-containing protein [Anaerolineales bacterium]MDP7645186.1 HRDC domain-containing protein [Anaerolineales bacterium]HJN41248.1 HRDC domain-containing protein [Anaerolineales bacterium]
MSAFPPPRLVCSREELRAMLHALRAQPAVAVDTESNSLHAYRERVCLIQFSIPAQDYIVDPLAIHDLAALQPLFADAEIKKVFHAAEYDLICLWRDFGWKVRGLFDTMMAARALGWEQVGLAAILSEQFSVPTSKRFQRADWGKRPLSEAQLAYAQLDTRYLLQLRERQAAALRRRGQWPEVSEEFERIARAGARSSPDSAAGQQAVDGFWRISGARKLDERERAVLRELHQYREGVAKRKDQPLYRVMGDATLLALAQRAPRSKRELHGIDGMIAGQIQRHAKGILPAVRRGLRAKPPPLPSSRSGGRRVAARYEALREWRKRRAQRRGLASDVILARDVLWALARAAPASMAELESVQDLGAWRRAEYGEEILRVLRAARA